MNNRFKSLFRVLLLATLMVAVTSCNNKKIEAAVQATLTAESAMNATVEARVSASQAAMPTSIPPMEPGIQPTITPDIAIEATIRALNATLTAMSAPEVAPETTLDPSTPVAILSPAAGSAVSQFNEVSGFVNRTALAGKFLNIIVTTRTGETWVQKQPTIDENGNWKSFPVVLGTPSIGKGESFEICAVIADEQLPEDRVYSYPVGPEACITVTRTD